MAARPQSVLVVDDNFTVRAALIAFIERIMGQHVCTTAGNGLDAVQKAEECKPDIVLLDLSMRGNEWTGSGGGHSESGATSKNCDFHTVL